MITVVRRVNCTAQPKHEKTEYNIVQCENLQALAIESKNLIPEQIQGRGEYTRVASPTAWHELAFSLIGTTCTSFDHLPWPAEGLHGRKYRSLQRTASLWQIGLEG